MGAKGAKLRQKGPKVGAVLSAEVSLFWWIKFSDVSGKFYQVPVKTDWYLVRCLGSVVTGINKTAQTPH